MDLDDLIGGEHGRGIERFAPLRLIMFVLGRLLVPDKALFGELTIRRGSLVTESAVAF